MNSQLLVLTVLLAGACSGQQRVLPSQPALLQRADGRYFALNANLQPGQLFHTPDGRVFTLASSPTAVAAASPAATIVTPAPAPASQSTVTLATQAPATSSVIVEARNQGNNDGGDVTTDNAFRSVGRQQSSVATIEAASPAAVPASTARLVPATATRFVNPQATTVIRNVLPTQQRQVITTGASPLAVSAAATPFFSTSGGLVFRSNPASPLVLPAGPVATATPVLTRAAPGQHLLADSNTDVFKGFFFYPNAGINFDF